MVNDERLEEEIVPLGTGSYDSLMEEIKPAAKTKKKQNKASGGKMSSGKDSEEKTK